MNPQPPIVSVIIAARPDQAEIKAVDAARQFNYPPDRLEIIVARGRQPSVQRNAAMKDAQGELIYFLDDDSVPAPENIERALGHFNDPSVKAVGGPSVCPPDAPPVEQMFAVVLSSWLAFGPSRARYIPVGQVRLTSEKELILCNQVARRAALLEHGGFNEALYPNEENALMDDLQKNGGKLVYDPELFVYRRPRRSLQSFIRMLMTYGRGRAEQFRVNPTFGSALNLVPPLFVLYIAMFYAVAIALRLGGHVESFQRFVMWGMLPLALYLFAAVLQTLASTSLHGVQRSILALPLLIASPVLYGIGFWRGLFTRLKRSGNGTPPAVELQRIEPG